MSVGVKIDMEKVKLEIEKVKLALHLPIKLYLQDFAVWLYIYPLFKLQRRQHFLST